MEAVRQSEIEPDKRPDRGRPVRGNLRFQRSGATNEEQAVSFVNLLLEAVQRDVPFCIITMF